MARMVIFAVFPANSVIQAFRIGRRAAAGHSVVQRGHQGLLILDFGKAHRAALLQHQGFPERAIQRLVENAFEPLLGLDVCKPFRVRLKNSQFGAFVVDILFPVYETVFAALRFEQNPGGSAPVVGNQVADGSAVSFE